jgi:hypothetical protein
MRSILVLCLLIPLCAAANAATLHHHRTRHNVIIRPNVASSFAAIPGFAYPGFAYRPPPPVVHYEDTPTYDDPSKFGGPTALPVIDAPAFE